MLTSNSEEEGQASGSLGPSHGTECQPHPGSCKLGAAQGPRGPGPTPQVSTRTVQTAALPSDASGAPSLRTPVFPPGNREAPASLTTLPLPSVFTRESSRIPSTRSHSSASLARYQLRAERHAPNRPAALGHAAPLPRGHRRQTSIGLTLFPGTLLTPDPRSNVRVWPPANRVPSLPAL